MESPRSASSPAVDGGEPEEGRALDILCSEAAPAVEHPTRAAVDPEFLNQLLADPDEVLECIVMARGGLAQLEESMPDSVHVEQRYRLIDGLSVSATAAAILELSHLPSVKSIEPVRPVTSY